MAWRCGPGATDIVDARSAAGGRPAVFRVRRRPHRQCWGRRVRDPARTIPRATLARASPWRWRSRVAVAAVLGPQRLARAAAPLSEAMRVAGVNWLILVVQIGAAWWPHWASLLALIRGLPHHLA